MSTGHEYMSRADLARSLHSRSTPLSSERSRMPRLSPRLDPMQVAPELPPPRRGTPVPRTILLVNPFYPKDVHASFGKHVLAPTLALTSFAATTPPAGPESTIRTGSRAAVASEMIPPLDCMMRGVKGDRRRTADDGGPSERVPRT